MDIDTNRVILSKEEYDALIIKADHLNKIEGIVQKEVTRTINDMLSEMEELPFPNACFISLDSICRICGWEYESTIQMVFEKKLDIIRRNLLGSTTNETEGKDIQNQPGMAE